jgi:4-amino-4-deoxy-L-arabinose transferase-like glycosyltransferase
MKRTSILFILVLVIATLLRFWRLGNYPALNADEAAIGYNAYSLIQTGRDEHGNSWPLDFQSFNDYKPGLYFYLVLPFVGALGLNEWAVRLPGALFGVAAVAMVYFLVREMFDDEWHALAASLFLAISPWHIHFSRGGWEANAATTFMLAGVYAFVLSRRRRGLYLLSAVAFAASLYTYHAARVVVPLILPGLVFVYRKEVCRGGKLLFLSGLVGFVFVLPLLAGLLRGNLLSRAAGVGLLSDSGPLMKVNEQRGEHGNYGGLIARLIHNKAVNYGLAFASNWGEHFSGDFLFISGDEIQRNKVPETGEMYLLDIVWLFVGLGAVARGYRKGWGLILWWFVVAPVAAALTFQSPHALRADNMTIPLAIISSFGMVVFLRWAARFRFGTLLYLAVGIGLVWGFVRYERMYWLHMAKEYPFSSQYGLKELVGYLKDQGEYSNVIVTNRYDQPYILFLFYLKYPPEEFQAEHVLTERDRFGFSTVEGFDKYRFVQINYDVIRPENPGSLIAGTDEEIPDGANVIKEIYGTNGYRYFNVVAN